MHRYVITTDNDKGRARLKQFFSEMKRIGRDEVEIFFGIDSKTYDRPVTPGKFQNNIGCKLAHIAILKDAIDKGYEEITVMENDLICSNYFESDYNYFMESVPIDWEMLRISRQFRPEMVMRLIPGSFYRCEDIGPYGTDLYIIRGKDAIKKVYIHLNEGSRDVPTDREIHKAPVKSYMTTYSLGMQRDNYVN